MRVVHSSCFNKKRVKKHLEKCLLADMLHYHRHSDLILLVIYHVNVQMHKNNGNKEFLSTNILLRFRHILEFLLCHVTNES